MKRTFIRSVLISTLCLAFASTGQAEDLKYKLFAAVETDNIADVKTFIAQGADLNARESDGTTPLMVAAAYGYADIAKLLIDKGAADDASQRDAAFAACCFNGHNFRPKLVELLIEKGANINVRGPNGETALMAAASAGNVHFLKFLLEKGADVNAANNIGNTALMYCAISGNTNMAMLLINDGANINARDSRGCGTALMCAAESGRMDLVDFLLKNGARINADDCSTALKRSVGGTNCIEFLIKGGADGEAKNDALTRAIAQNRPDLVRALIDNGASLNDTKRGLQALEFAIALDNKNMIEVLIDNGADVNGTNHIGDTMLLRAVFHGYSDVVKLLIAKGANVNAKDYRGATVLDYAIAFAERADTWDRDTSPEELADKAEKHEIVRLLTAAGAKVTGVKPYIP